MVSKKKINGWAAVALVFLVCAVVYGLLSSYPRELAVYSDELRYLDVARSLLQGRGLRVRNMPSDYQKILYPLCILPALLLRTTAAQITAIGWPVSYTHLTTYEFFYIRTAGNGTGSITVFNSGIGHPVHQNAFSVGGGIIHRYHDIRIFNAEILHSCIVDSTEQTISIQVIVIVFAFRF